MLVGGAVTEPPPVPTVSRVLAGTLVTLDTTLARAAPVGPFGELSVDGLEFSLITIRTSTIASTTTTLPDATGRRALRGDLLPAAAVALCSACLAHARFVQPFCVGRRSGRTSAGSMPASARRRIPSSGYRAPC